MQCPECGTDLERLGYLNYHCPACNCNVCHDSDCNDPECEDPNHFDMECKPIFGSMISCPECGSIYTKIKDDHYVCYECKYEYGYVVGSRVHCPVCQSPRVREEAGLYYCLEDNCNKVFANFTDRKVRFPSRVIFPTRNIEEFYRRRIYGDAKEMANWPYLDVWFDTNYLEVYFEENG